MQSMTTSMSMLIVLFLYTKDFFFFFYNCIVPLGFLPTGNSGCYPREGQLRQSRVTLPAVPAGCFSVSIIHRTRTWTIGSLNVCTDVNACGCTRGCTDTVKESALKVDSGRTIPDRSRGIEPASTASDDLVVGDGGWGWGWGRAERPCSFHKCL